MIQIMLVDDELLTRTKIKSIINWEAYGFHICAECSDGTEAVKYLNTYHDQVQIMITDIKMNKMDGDKLVALVRQKYPNIFIIILSGYDDYKYIRDTMKHGAQDYLLKNDLNKENLLEIFENIRKLIDEDQCTSYAPDNLEQLRNKFVMKVLTGLCNDVKQLESTLQSLHINLDKRNVAAILVQLENFQGNYKDMSLKERNLFEFSVCNIVNEILMEQKGGYMTGIGDGKFVILVSYGSLFSEAKIAEQLNALLKRISFCLNKFMNLSANFVVGSFEAITGIEKSYKNAEKKSRELYNKKSGTIIFYNAEMRITNSGSTIKLSFEEEQKLSAAIKKQDNSEVKAIIGTIFRNLEEVNIERSQCVQLLNDFAIFIFQICKKYQVNIQNIYKNKQPIYEYLLNLDNLEKCEEFFLNLFENLIYEIAEINGNSQYSENVQKAIIYIKAHFKEDITLSRLALELKMNTAYLSSVFNHEVGMGFSEYINNLRLEYAKELMDLKKNKIKEVVELSGFNNYPYFFNLFKKKYGITPKEYLKKLT